MAIPRHLDEAAGRLEKAAVRIERARAAPPSVESVHEWLDALTDYSEAASDLQRFANESVHEKLHAIARHLGLEHTLTGVEPSEPHGH